MLTTNVNHQFQLAGFDKRGCLYAKVTLWLVAVQQAMLSKRHMITKKSFAAWLLTRRICVYQLILSPRCPVCGEPMTMNLRCDNTFVQDEGWYEAAHRYEDFMRRHQGMKILF